MTRSEQLATALGGRFEDNRPMLRALAFRLTGSVRESEAAVEAARTQLDGQGLPDALRAGLITATARHCLTTLRSLEHHEWHVPDVVVSDADGHTPEQLALLGGATGVALFVALDTLSPEERVASVLRDGAGVAYDEIGELLDVSARAAESLAGAGRERVSAAPETDVPLLSQRRLVRAYYREAKRGDADAVRGLLHEGGVTLRSDAGEHAISTMVDDPETVARRAVMFARVPTTSIPALVNGAAGAAIVGGGQVTAVVGMTVVGDRIAEIDFLADPTRLAGLDLPTF